MIDKQFIVRNKEMAKTNQTSLIYYTCPYVNNYRSNKSRPKNKPSSKGNCGKTLFERNL